MRSIVVLNAGGTISAAMLPPLLRKPNPLAMTQGGSDGKIVPLWLIEKRAIEHAITLCQGNIPKAAELLRISPSTIYRKRQAWAAGEEG
jgi:two-component system repressor protein LuxO